MVSDSIFLINPQKKLFVSEYKQSVNGYIILDYFKTRNQKNVLTKI